MRSVRNNTECKQTWIGKFSHSHTKYTVDRDLTIAVILVEIRIAKHDDAETFTPSANSPVEANANHSLRNFSRIITQSTHSTLTDMYFEIGL